ncbi:hypothetical protein ACQE98_05485 [Ornithinimicrobium sp. W1679]|uniref:hypothetical protein n=1 Tax=unclassified Ornithinimicrobium TaxID=2615080 RepID=UPI003CF38333
MRWRYLVACVLVGVAVSATVGAVTGVATALTGGASANGVDGGAASAVGSGLAGLIVGAALGALLGILSGAVTTVAAGGHRDRATVAVRAGSSAGVVHAAGLTGLAALSWGRPEVGGGSVALQVAGVVVPSLLAAVLSAWACAEVAGMEPGDLSPDGRSA